MPNMPDTTIIIQVMGIGSIFYPAYCDLNYYWANNLSIAWIMYIGMLFLRHKDAIMPELQLLMSIYLNLIYLMA